MTMCIYDGGTVATFEHFNSACAFMEEMEEDGYFFEFCGNSGAYSIYKAR